MNNENGKAQLFVNVGGWCNGRMMGHDPKGLVQFKTRHVYLIMFCRRIAQLVERWLLIDRLQVQVLLGHNKNNQNVANW